MRPLHDGEKDTIHRKAADHCQSYHCLSQHASHRMARQGSGWAKPYQQCALDVTIRKQGRRLACHAVLEDLQGCGRTGRCMAPVCAHKAPCGCKGRGERRSTCACIRAAVSFCCLQNSDLMGIQVCGLWDVLLSPLLRVDAALQRHALASECRHSSTSLSFCSFGPWADTVKKLVGQQVQTM